MFPHLLKGRVGTRTEIRLPPELTIHKPTNPRRCSSPEEFKWEGEEMPRGKGPHLRGWRSAPVQAQTIPGRRFSSETLQGGAGRPYQAQHPHFTSKLTEAQRGEARCRGHTEEQT